MEEEEKEDDGVLNEGNGKIILDLCGGTGSWSKFYKESGYDVRIITLPQYDVTKVEFNSHAMEFEIMDVHYKDTLCIPYEDVYGILAAPPCTEFSLAKGSRPRNLKSAMEVVEACLKIIFHCRFTGNLKFWAMENPVGLLRQFIGKPAFSFQQWQFGDMQIKPTDLWGYFRDPKPTIKERPAALTIQFPNGRSNSRGWSKPECPEEYKHLNLNRAAKRAITPPGFAKAFYLANQ